MPGRAIEGRFVAGLAICLALLAHRVARRAYSSDEEGASSDTGDGTQRAIAAGLSSPQHTFPRISQQHSSEHEQNDELDTPSERSVAQSTRNIAKLTGALVGIGLLSAFVSGFQWWEIHSGSNDTHLLAESTKLQAATLKDTEERQLRAYVGPTFDTFNCVGCDAAAMIPFNEGSLIEFKAENFGSTPAKSIYICHRVIITSLVDIKPKVDDFFRSCNVLSDQQKIILPTIFPKESRKIHASGDFPAYLLHDLQVADDAHGLFFLAIIEYEDVFGIIHKTYVCRNIKRDFAIQGLDFLGCNLRWLNYIDE